MISKNKSKFIKSLQKKNIRDQQRLYVIEGDKIVSEYLGAGRSVRMLLAKPEFINSLETSQKELVAEIVVTSYEELKQISTLKTPHNAIAVVHFNEYLFDTDKIFSELAVVLDFVQDPGNMGTIIRAAAWFGIKNLICSVNSVDVYNPKVIQSSMGAILHVNIFYYDLNLLLNSAKKKNVKIFGALLDGKSIYEHELADKGLIVLGNESKGISDNLLPYISDRILIPSASGSTNGRESLNVGMAASVIFSEFLRRKS